MCGLHVARLVASTVTAAAAGSLFVVGAVGGRGGDEADGEARSEEQGREEAQSAAPHAARSAAPLSYFPYS